MMRFFIILLFLSWPFLAISQQSLHTLYLRDGTIFVGETLEITGGIFPKENDRSVFPAGNGAGHEIPALGQRSAKGTEPQYSRKGDTCDLCEAALEFLLKRNGKMTQFTPQNALRFAIFHLPIA